MSGSLDNKEIMSNNLRFYISLSGKKRKKIASDLGVSYSTLTDWINGNTYPRIDKIEMLANYFGIRKSNLVEDNSIMQEHKVANISSMTDTIANLSDEIDKTYFNIEKEINSDFILRVRDNSMIGARIHEGDLAFIKSQPSVEDGEIAAVLIDGYTIILKRVFSENGKVKLISENPRFPTKVHDKCDIKIVGKLVAVLYVL